MAEGQEWRLGRAVRAIGRRCDWCAGSQRLTPHLASPLEGGRDELGKRWVRFGSCLRRNDKGERGYGGGAGMAVGESGAGDWEAV